MTWINDFMLYRGANLSNVFLVETDDPKRLREFIDFIKNLQGFKKYLVSLQTSEIEDLETFRSELLNPRKLVSMLRENPTVMIITWVTTSHEAESMIPFIVAVSQDPGIYCPVSERSKPKPKPSTAIIFTHSLSLFPENIRKLSVELMPPISTEEERKSLLENLARGVKNLFNLDVTVKPEIIVASSGLNLHEVESASLLSLKKYKDFKVEVFRDFKIQLLKNYGLEVIYPKRGFESVGGYKYLKEYFRTRIVDAFKNPELVRRYGESMPRGVLLYGYPGTGKTWFAKALSKELGFPMIKLGAADFLRGIVGETEARVRRIVRLLESLAPAVVFIDEIDQLFINRANLIATDSGVSRRLQNMLLDWLGDENRKTFVIGATNYVEQMDFAAVRVGRFDKIVFVGLPDLEARKEILRVHFEVVRKPEVSVEVDYDLVASRTALWSGAELENLVRETLMEARVRRLEKITTDLVLEVKERLPINTSKRLEEFKRMIEVTESLINVDVRSVEEARKVLAEVKKVGGEFRLSGL